MTFIADLHIHSHYSLATSKQLTPEWLDYWARLKGIGLVATGDFTHRKWTNELKKKLVASDNGLFVLDPGCRIDISHTFPELNHQPVRFVLSAEISSIYKKYGKVRKIHSLLYAPDFEIVEKIQEKLSAIGNIDSDGRPILGFDAVDLLKLVKDIDPSVHFIPAHIWTPWFSVLGDKSGFNSIEECFGDLCSEITALETGLSTDIPLNRMCSFLDRYSLVSNSDAHSPDRLGRNANIFHCDWSYNDIFNSLKQQNDLFGGTIDLYPQEGKYHYDGHRKCNICWNPVETLRNRGVCTVCGKPVIIGVANRIAQISDRTDLQTCPVKTPYRYIIPLPEILSEILSSNTGTKQVKDLYLKLIQQLGSEFDILLYHSLEKIYDKAGPVLCEAIRRMRTGEVILSEGFDGQYGSVKVFSQNENRYLNFEPLRFDAQKPQLFDKAALRFNLTEYHQLRQMNYQLVSMNDETAQLKNPLLRNLNSEQQNAVTSESKNILVIAGPGTGKTAVLTTRIAFLITNMKANPKTMVALTFTQKAAAELESRIVSLLHDEKAKGLFAGTFHAFGLNLIKKYLTLTGRKPGFSVIDEKEKLWLCSEIAGLGTNQAKKIAKAISDIKQNPEDLNRKTDKLFLQIFSKYEQKLLQFNLFDFDDLIYIPYQLAVNQPQIASEIQSGISHLFVDEFQDLNPMQYKWLRQLATEHVGVFAIGDPNQSIYGFRGSNPKLPELFQNDFKPVEIHKLTTCYRCSERIIKASSQVIGNSALTELAGKRKGVKISIVPHIHDIAEANWIISTISELMGGLDFLSSDTLDTTFDTDTDITSLSDIAILCRTHTLLEFYANQLKQKGIPVRLATDNHDIFENQFEVIFDLLRLSVNPDSDFLKHKLQNKGIEPEKIIGLNTANAAEYVENISEKLFVEGNKNIWIEQLILVSRKNQFSCQELIEYLQTGGITGLWEIRSECINLMTMHASKGLEFKCVFIPACEDNIIPYRLFKNNTDINEEKRLLYVAMTRAEKRLFISHAMQRRYQGQDLQNKRSPFIDIIENELIEPLKKHQKKTKDDTRQLSLF